MSPRPMTEAEAALDALLSEREALLERVERVEAAIDKADQCVSMDCGAPAYAEMWFNEDGPQQGIYCASCFNTMLRAYPDASYAKLSRDPAPVEGDARGGLSDNDRGRVLRIIEDAGLDPEADQGCCVLVEIDADDQAALRRLAREVPARPPIRPRKGARMADTDAAKAEATPDIRADAETLREIRDATIHGCLAGNDRAAIERTLDYIESMEARVEAAEERLNGVLHDREVAEAQEARYRAEIERIVAEVNASVHSCDALEKVGAIARAALSTSPDTETRGRQNGGTDDGTTTQATTAQAGPLSVGVRGSGEVRAAQDDADAGTHPDRPEQAGRLAAPPDTETRGCGRCGSDHPSVLHSPCMDGTFAEADPFHHPAPPDTERRGPRVCPEPGCRRHAGHEPDPCYPAPPDTVPPEGARTYVPDTGEHEGHLVTRVGETERWAYSECECGEYWRYTSDAAEDHSREKHRWGETATTEEGKLTKEAKARCLVQARLRVGLTQAKAAKQLGVSPPLVSMWESGTRDPGTAQLLAMSRLYGCSVDALLRPAPTVADHLDKHDLSRLREITRFTTDALPERTSQLHQEDAELLDRLLAEHDQTSDPRREGRPGGSVPDPSRGHAGADAAQARDSAASSLPAPPDTAPPEGAAGRCSDCGGPAFTEQGPSGATYSAPCDCWRHRPASAPPASEGEARADAQGLIRYALHCADEGRPTAFHKGELWTLARALGLPAPTEARAEGEAG